MILSDLSFEWLIWDCVETGQINNQASKDGNLEKGECDRDIDNLHIF